MLCDALDVFIKPEAQSCVVPVAARQNMTWHELPTRVLMGPFLRDFGEPPPTK